MTPHQPAVLNFVIKHWRDKNYAPTIREIGKELGYKGWSSPHAIVMNLIARGLLTHVPHEPRSIRPTGKCPLCGRGGE